MVRVSGACLLLAVDDQAPTGGAGRLDGALDDHRQEGEGVVGRGQRLAEAVDRLLDTLALEGDSLGHLVERAAERRELVAAPDSNLLAVLPAGDQPGRVGELLQGADDRAAEEPRQHCDDCERGEGEEEETLAQVADGRVDLTLRRHGDERHRRATAQDRCRNSAIFPAAELDVARPLTGNLSAAEQRARAGDHLPSGCEQEVVFALKPGVGPKLAEERVVEGDPDHDAPELHAVGRGHDRPALRGELRRLAPDQ
jgi:hypothetical protein